MTELALALGLSVLAAWDYGRRRLNREKELVTELGKKQEELVSLLSDFEKQQAKNTNVLKTFLESMTDIIKISEEEKQELRNRIQAQKIGKKL